MNRGFVFGEYGQLNVHIALREDRCSDHGARSSIYGVSSNSQYKLGIRSIRIHCNEGRRLQAMASIDQSLYRTKNL